MGHSLFATAARYVLMVQVILLMLVLPAKGYIYYPQEDMDQAKEALRYHVIFSGAAAIADSAKVLLVGDEIVELYERRDFLLVRASVIGFEEPDEMYAKVGFNKGRAVSYTIKEIYCGGLVGYEVGGVVESLYYGSVPGRIVSVQALSPGDCKSSSGRDSQVLFPGAEVLLTVWDGYPRAKKASRGSVVTYVWRHLVVGDGGVLPGLRLDAIVNVMESRVCALSSGGSHED
jgi:hypothetical protein